MSQKAPEIRITEQQQKIVRKIAQSRTEPQRLVERAKIILRSAKQELCVDQAQALGINAQRVRRWRKRYADSRSVLEAIENEPKSASCLEDKIREILSDEYRSGTPSKFTPEEIACLIALACKSPEEYGLPISHWTPGDLARQAMKTGLVKSISGRHLDRFLKGSRLTST